MDSGDDRLGWRGLAVRVVTSFLEVRALERVEAAGRSPTWELLWSWAQQNARVQDLLRVLQDMGHHSSLQLFQAHIQSQSQTIKESRLPPSNQHAEVTRQMSAAGVKVELLDVFSFHTACMSYSQYQHPNILDLLGCFSDEERYCLVYPYLPNGSLFHRLHHQDGKPPLSWQERLTIIKGVAKALHHLHTAQPCPVICGNISSANILLDDALQPKLSDFGLAHLRPNSVNQYCTITLDMSSYRNLGYLPKECIRGGKLSFSLDVYSFGMVIMETLTGRKVIEAESKQRLLRDLLASEVEDSGGVDSCLRFLDVVAGRWPTSVALSLLRLALDCTASRCRSRPNMENVSIES
ncbi:hypothetical protein PAMP_014720 [Pampus punctatissimus]